ncbi:MAG: protein BatD [Legionella sp.]|nr:MAG: protein BatD [Legionella sp.]
MVSMKKIAIILLSLLSFYAQAEIQVQVDPSKVSLGETFQLTLRQDNSPNGGVPDLTGLQPDFSILGTERNVSYSIINGQSTSVNQWVVTLRARKSGILTIPAIKMGSEQSTPITINVETSAAKSPVINLDSSQNQDVFLTTSVDENKPYINQQIIYTVKVYNSKRLLDAEYQGPEVEDALLIPLGDTKRYQTNQNDINYIVEEQNYAIYPQKSGTLKITSPVFNALVYDMNPQQVKAQDKTIELTVQPIPKPYKGANWFPAQQVKLTETYENTEQNMEEGSTLSRTVTIEGVGLPAQLLPSLKFTENDAFKVYPEKGKDHNQVVQGELVGSSEIKVTYLFNKAGKVTIPELKISWFNTKTNKQEFAILPPRSLDIKPSVLPNKSAATTSTTQKNSSSSKTEINTPVAQTQNSWAWISAILFALAWLFTLGLWAWQKYARLFGKRQYKKALAELNQACTECNPTKARDALLKWATMYWPDAQLLNLTDLNQLVRDAHLKKQLNLLSQVLYRTEEKTLWRGDELLRSVLALSKTKPNKTRASNPLPPINPF